jgi:outer membrane protein OmpA-like peptidoglycan-associated protein
MKASDAIGRKTAQEQCHDIAREGPGIARLTSVRPASFGGIAVLVFLVGSISACSSACGTRADSVQTTLGGGASSSATQTAPREKIVLEGVRFKPDGSGLRPNSQAILDSAVELLKSHPDMKVYVDTYCDPTGGTRLNLRLSQQRAALVSAYLEDHGIASDRLIARGFGATHFIARNETVDGRVQNRRIELLLIE